MTKRNIYTPSLVSSAVIINSKSVPSPNRLRDMISRFNSKTEIPVPSNATLVGSFWDLKRKKTDDDIVNHGPKEPSAWRLDQSQSMARS